MPLTEITANIPPALVDCLEEHFCLLEESPWMILHPRPEDSVALSGFFSDPDSARQGWAELRETFAKLPADPTLNLLQDVEWKDSYKFHLRPWQSGRLRWIPEWERGQHLIAAEEAVVYLDSGLAFGTGSHETTRLCATALVDYEMAHPDSHASALVVDAGCGSGILALSAAALGYVNVFGFDNDPEAIRVSCENGVFNEMSGIRWATDDLAGGLPQASADLLLANIQSDVLIKHHSLLIDALRPGAWLSLSGILAHEAEAVETCFRQGFQKRGSAIAGEISYSGEWAGVLFRLRK